MTVAPRVSVVLAVFNGERTLQATLDSVLNQTFRDFELVVVDDGSTDNTPAILREACRDERIRVISQENRGLTRALIEGCRAARGQLIARQDCGDVSFPQRLEKQLAMFDGHAGTVLVSCSTRYVGPKGELLYVVTGDGEAIRASLRNDDVDHIRGLSHHGSAMFTRIAYQTAGGYREHFRVAQDLDLWIRIAALGAMRFVPEVLYEATIDTGAISMSQRRFQLAAARVAIELRNDRDGIRQESLLSRAAAIRPVPRTRRVSESEALYFIASCLRRNGDRRWRRYLIQALRRNPLLWRGWLQLLGGRR